VVDASVAVKWYVPEPDSKTAVAVLEGDSTLFSPDLLIAELGNTLWKKVRRGELTAEEAADIAGGIAGTPPVTLRSSAQLLRAAVELATEYDRTVDDALYLALAVAEDTTLVTADDRLVNALRDTPLAPFVRHLNSATAV